MVTESQHHLTLSRPIRLTHSILKLQPLSCHNGLTPRNSPILSLFISHILPLFSLCPFLRISLIYIFSLSLCLSLYLSLYLFSPFLSPLSPSISISLFYPSLSISPLSIFLSSLLSPSLPLSPSFSPLYTLCLSPLEDRSRCEGRRVQTQSFAEGRGLLVGVGGYYGDSVGDGRAAGIVVVTSAVVKLIGEEAEVLEQVDECLESKRRQASLESEVRG